MKKARTRWLLAALIVILAGGGYVAWLRLASGDLPEGIASGNGRIEAVEIDISTKIAGRIREILVDEGDLVDAGQILARMDTVQLEAQRRQAEANPQRAIGVDTAKSVATQREAEKTAAEAVVGQREAELDEAAGWRTFYGGFVQSPESQQQRPLVLPCFECVSRRADLLRHRHRIDLQRPSTRSSTAPAAALSTMASPRQPMC